MSSLSRYVATLPEAVKEAAEPSEKIYSFLLKDLAKASANNHSHGQAIASQAPYGLKAKALAGKKNQSTKPYEKDWGSKVEDGKIASVAFKAALYLRSSMLDPFRRPSWMNHQSIHSYKETIS